VEQIRQYLAGFPTGSPASSFHLSIYKGFGGEKDSSIVAIQWTFKEMEYLALFEVCNSQALPPSLVHSMSRIGISPRGETWIWWRCFSIEDLRILLRAVNFMLLTRNFVTPGSDASVTAEEYPLPLSRLMSL